MRLAAIYNVWDSEELLTYSIGSIKDHVDIFIFVFQTKSNYGEEYDPTDGIMLALKNNNIPYADYVLQKYDPIINLGGTANETEKRNIGIAIAHEYGCTHFLHMDCDEMYQDFGNAKQEYIDSGTDGSVCEMYTYFKKPTLIFENVDNYFVPFIHKLHPHTISGIQNEYPFYADPTRRINCSSISLIQEKMHHFSYVRKDIERKMRNSSAKINIEKSRYLEYYNSDLKAGDFIEGFDQKLIEVENLFNIQV
jgi:hypothetical protein